MPGDMRIPFSNLIVSFDGQGNPMPAGNIVKTDLTELPFKLFGYLPVKMVGEDLIAFTRGSDGKGQLNGKIRIAFGAIQGYRGWSMNDNSNIALATAGSTTAGKITLFSSGGAQAGDENYALVAETGAQVAGQLYGFGVGLNSGTVDKDGIRFAGSIATPASGSIRSISIPINKLAMNRALTVSAVLLNQDAIPTLEIATWKISIQGLIFNEDGFRIGGNLALAIPKSDVSMVGFSDLSIAKTGLFGGKFNIPDGGINILSMAFLHADRSTLAFGRVGNSDVYRLAGKASLKVDVTILQAPLKVPSFEILTNGDFSVQAPSDYHLPVGPFDFALTNLIINSKDNTPSIVLQGKFKADFAFLKFEIGEINIRPAGGGPTFSVAKNLAPSSMLPSACL